MRRQTSQVWRLEAHIDAQNFNLILTHKIVYTFFLDGLVSSRLRDFWTSLASVIEFSVCVFQANFLISTALWYKAAMRPSDKIFY